MLSLVESFDPASGEWSSKSPMPEAWEYMSTGPMPVYPNGVALIPFSYKTSSAGGIVASLEYDTKNDSWAQGPVPAVASGKYVVVQGALE